MSTTRKPFLTRRRVVMGALLLVLILAVAGSMFGVFDAESQVKMTFLRFEALADGISVKAIMRVKNESKRTFLQFSEDGVKNVICLFRAPARHRGSDS